MNVYFIPHRCGQCGDRIIEHWMNEDLRSEQRRASQDDAAFDNPGDTSPLGHLFQSLVAAFNLPLEKRSCIVLENKGRALVIEHHDDTYGLSDDLYLFGDKLDLIEDKLPELERVLGDRLHIL